MSSKRPDLAASAQGVMPVDRIQTADGIYDIEFRWSEVLHVLEDETTVSTVFSMQIDDETLSAEVAGLHLGILRGGPALAITLKDARAPESRRRGLALAAISDTTGDIYGERVLAGSLRRRDWMSLAAAIGGGAIVGVSSAPLLGLALALAGAAWIGHTIHTRDQVIWRQAALRARALHRSRRIGLIDGREGYAPCALESNYLVTGG